MSPNLSRRPHRISRAPVIAVSFMAVSQLAWGAPASPDVAVLRDDLALREGTLLASIRNTGSVPVEQVSVGVAAEPPEPTGVVRRGEHHLSAGVERGWCLWAERVDAWRARLHVLGSGDRAGLRAGGEMEITGADACEVTERAFEPAELLYASADGVFRWQNRFDAGDQDGFCVDLALGSGQDPLIRLTAQIDGFYRPGEVWLGIQRAYLLPARVRLSDLLGERHVPPMVQTQVTARLDPGETRRVAIDLPPSMADSGRDLYVIVDPGDEMREAREGNNVARLKAFPEIQACQLHLHSSLGGADGSLDNQLYHAAASGTDAVFITDDDWRVSLFSYCTGFDLHFPELSTTVYVGSEGFLQRLVEARQSSALVVTRSMEPYPDRPERFLMLDYSVSEPPRPGEAHEYRLRWETARRRLAYPLSAGVRLGFAVLPPAEGADAALLVRVALSTQVGAARDMLTYVVGGSGELGPDVASGAGPVIPLSWSREGWGDVSLDLSGDAERYLTHGLDNAISSISFALRARSGQGSLGLDNLTISAERSGEWLVRRQRAEMGAYPNLAVFVSPAASYYPPRFGVIGAEGLSLDYASIDPSEYAAQAVALAHEKGDLVVFQYPGASSGTAAGGATEDPALRRWAREGLCGADLFEAGFRPRAEPPLEPRMQLVDQCLRDGTFIVAVGVSGADGGALSRAESNFVTWVHASSADLPSIQSAFRAGRAFFGDPLGFQGRLDLSTPEGFLMGDIVITTNAEHVVRATLRRLPRDAEVLLVSNGEPTGPPATADADGNAVAEARIRVGEEGAAVRAEAVDIEGLPIVVGNPIVFLPQMPRGKVLPPFRGGCVLGDLIVRDVEGFAVSDVRTEDEELLVQGVGEGGGLTFVFGARGMPRDVRRISSYGVATEVPCEWLPNGARVTGLSGPCTVQVRWNRATDGRDGDDPANGGG